MRVLLADDHKLFRESLRSMLVAYDIEVVGTARDGLEAVAKARALTPDVVLMDIQMPRCDGFKATRVIKAEMPHVIVVVLSAHDDESYLSEAESSGASAYLLKTLDVPKLVRLLSELAPGANPGPNHPAPHLPQADQGDSRPTVR